MMENILNIPMQEPDGDELQPEEGWRVQTPGAAEWALKKILELRAARNREIAAAEESIAFYKAAIDRAEEKCAQREEYLTARLREWFDTQPKRELRASFAVDLPSGKLSRDKAPKLEYIRDAEKLSAFVRENAPEFLKITYSVDWAELKKHLTVSDGVCTVDTTGEVVDGITVRELAPEFRIRV